MEHFKFTSNKNSFKIISKKKLLSTEVVDTAPIEELSKNVADFDKRAFLKVLGVAGLGLAATSLFPKKSEALIIGGQSTSGVLGVKNSSDVRINPAKEDGNLASIKTNTDKLTFDSSNNLLTSNTISELSANNIGNSINDQSLWMLRKITNLLKPLGMVTGSGNNRLSIDINSLPTLGTVTTVTTVTGVTTVSTLTNLGNIGNVNAFSLMKDTARNSYSNSMRSKISF
jgi:hypothetical protein